ncbi:MAG: hypothetical protein CVT63_07610 [Candidatus Anoxymicrobium japonicum]|uniref:PPM-type phosphatase domain-containing protein n=1 Tax=Candidatus Anoxymicrobium japonicum TaxID=2013648 RepID=A0A2N3G4I6_9ACTN|nr:MAG: hypothetical protein CVT63_07610 [Candidatus Anoxymicrobium japonicum]
MAEAKAENIGVATHPGEKQAQRDAHFVYDYTRRRVPMPVVSYVAVADTPFENPGLENPAKKALDRLRDLIEPAAIAEEELNSASMQSLIRDNLAIINSEIHEARTPEAGVRQEVSLTMVIADARRAYIGHAGSCRVYLLHSERLYDLTPQSLTEIATTSSNPGDLSTDAMTLFPVNFEVAATEAPPLPAKGVFLGQETEAYLGYNEVDITPGDIIVLVTDGLWRTVSEEEMVENLLSAINVQRSSSQLVRLAFSRDASDNATMAAWQYIIGGDKKAIREPGAASKAARERIRTRATEGILLALLIVVLAGIFTVGFAFGWRISDTFRKPEKQKARHAAQARSEKTSKITQPSSSAPVIVPVAAKVAATATVKGRGVRMRSTADSSGSAVGMFKEGETVTILEDVIGADGKSWSKVKGFVSATGTGKRVELEGFVRSDFLIKQ